MGPQEMASDSMTAKRKPAAKRPGAELGTLLDAGVADDRQAMVFGGHGAEIADPGTQQEIWDWMAALAADEASTAAE